MGEPVQMLVVLQIEVCGDGGRNLPQDVNVLILETYVCVILQDRRTANEVMDLAMAKYTGLYRWAQDNFKFPYKREAGVSEWEKDMRQ